MSANQKRCEAHNLLGCLLCFGKPLSPETQKIVDEAAKVQAACEKLLPRTPIIVMPDARPNPAAGLDITKTAEKIAIGKPQTNAAESVDGVASPEKSFEGFETVALRNAAFGYKVFPTTIRPDPKTGVSTKKPCIKKFPELATADAAVIRQWSVTPWIQERATGVGLLATPEGHLFIDEDLSAEFRRGYEAFARESFPVSRTTSARENRCQSAWLQTDYTRAHLRNITQEKTKDGMFSLRFSNLYVQGEGSQHPSGSVYRVVVDAPAIPMPDKLVDYLLSLTEEKHASASAASVTVTLGDADYTIPPKFDSVIVEPGRNNRVSEFAWHIYQNVTTNPDEMLEIVSEYNRSHCQPPLDDGEVQTIANGKIGKPVTGANAIIRHSDSVISAKPKVEAVAEPIEDVKATSLLVFSSAEDVSIAEGDGYHAVLAADFKLPLDSAYHRVVACGSEYDDALKNVSNQMNGHGVIFITYPPKKTRFSFTDRPVPSKSDWLAKCMAGKWIKQCDVRDQQTQWTQIPKNASITVTNNATEAEETETEIVSEMPQSALASTRLGDIYADLFQPNDWTLDLALPALVTAASVLVPPFVPEQGMIYADDNVVSLYTALIAKTGGGKSQVTEWAAKALNIWKQPVGAHYLEGKWGSAEQMFNDLAKKQTQMKNAVLINPDEMSHLLAKAGIPNASFAAHLTSMYYRRRYNLTIARNKELNIRVAVSLIGGVVDEAFGEVFNAATIGGLWDRTLFGEAPPNFSWSYREYPFPISEAPLDPAPVAVRADGSVTEVEKAWRKKDAHLGRIVEVCIRVAKIYASLEGRPVVTGRDLEALYGLAMRQKAIRTLRQPNAGVTPDAIFANAVTGWLRSHTKGEWVNVTTLKNGIHCYEMKLGPSVAERSLHAMSRGDQIDLWLPTKDKNGMANSLPADYAGPRPRIGLVRFRVPNRA